jgi:hypothetical protein
MTILNQIINGIQIGSIYALVALGYTMVYGIVKAWRACLGCCTGCRCILCGFGHGDRKSRI